MRQWMIDAFASAPFKGNPACVVEPFDAWPEASWMQALAKENNQAETAFLLRTADPARFGLRWFTPGEEVKLCGHATLASGHALHAEMGVDAATITFETRWSGELKVSRLGDLYEMDFPADPPRRTPAPEGLARALGVEPVEVWAGRYLVAVLADETAVRSLTPEIAALTTIKGEALDAGHVCVAALADAGRGYDVVDRFFAPGAAVPEDPTTGSMHCILGPLFADRLGKPVVRFHQAYPGRGGDLETEWQGERILLRGAAVTVLAGELRL